MTPETPGLTWRGIQAVTVHKITPQVAVIDSLPDGMSGSDRFVAGLRHWIIHQGRQPPPNRKQVIRLYSEHVDDFEQGQPTLSYRTC